MAERASRLWCVGTCRRFGQGFRCRGTGWHRLAPVWYRFIGLAKSQLRLYIDYLSGIPFAFLGPVI